MPKFLVRARYSNEAFRGFLEDPADRKKQPSDYSQELELHCLNGFSCQIREKA